MRRIPTLPIPGIGDHATSISLYSALSLTLSQGEDGKGLPGHHIADC